MTRSQKVLGKVNATNVGNGYQTLYTAPTGKTALVSNITVTNTTGNEKTFDISFFKDGVNATHEALFFTKDNDNYGQSMLSDDGINWIELDFGNSVQEAVVTKEGKIITMGDNVPGPAETTNTQSVTIDPFDAFNDGQNITIYQNANIPGYNGKILDLTDCGSVNFDYALITNNDYNGWNFYTNNKAKQLGQWTFKSYVDYEVDAFVYGNNVFMAWNEDNGSYQLSTDGATWTSYETPINLYQNWHGFNSARMASLAFLNNKFIVTDGYNSVAYSDNGIDWEVVESDYAGDASWYSIAFAKVDGEDRYVMYEDGFAYYALTSTDLINWSSSYLPVAYYADGGFVGQNTKNGSIFVGLGDYGNGMASTDGYSWEVIGTSASGFWCTWAGQISPKNIYKNKIYSSLTVKPNDFIVLEPGIICSPGSSVVVSSTPGLTFSIYGAEIS